MKKSAIAAVAAVTVATAAVIWRRKAPRVGHWRSATGRAAFMERYDEAFRAMPPPAATIDVPTSFGVVRIYRFGGAKEGLDPLVLLPGRASASPVWADALPYLLRISDVYTLDLLGEPGMSVQSRAITDDEDQASWLHQALAGLSEARLNVVGLSIGGWTATNLALHRPDKIATLTLIDPMNVLADLPLETIVRSIPASVPALPKAWRDGFNSWTAGGAPVTDEPVARMIESGMRHYALALPQPRRIAEGELRLIGLPVLAIVAGRSVMHHGADALATALRVFGPEAVRYYPTASHAISGEYPSEVACDVSKFLKKIR